MFDYLIVGAGFAGSVLAERLASGSNKKVLICDKRPHIGGNATLGLAVFNKRRASTLRSPPEQCKWASTIMPGQPYRVVRDSDVDSTPLAAVADLVRWPFPLPIASERFVP